MRKNPEEIAASGNSIEVQSWLESATLDELIAFRKYRSQDSHESGLAQLYVNKKLAEDARQPHWTERWGFWVAVVSAMLALTAIVIAVLAWLRPVAP